MTAPYAGKRGQRVIVVFDENSMELDPSLPAPWWPEYGDDTDHYRAGDIVVYNHRFYRCRRDIPRTGKNFDDEPQRSAWIDITRGIPEVREQLPDAVAPLDGPVDIAPNRRLYVDTRKGPVQVRLAPPDNWVDGDVIEIVDDYQSFKDNPCTLLNNGVRINSAEDDPNQTPKDLDLNTTGTQNIWRFIYYVNRNNPTDQWLYTDSAPGSSGGGGGSPVEIEEIEGPTAEGQPYKIGPSKIYVVKTANGPVEMIPDGTFKNGDTFTIIDHDWTFGKMDADWNSTNAAYLLPTDDIKYRDCDDEGKFALDVKGNSSAWPFIYYKGLIHCLAAPISQFWTDTVADRLNGDPLPKPDGSDPTPAPQSGALDSGIDMASLFEDAPEPEPDPEPEIPVIAPSTIYRIYNRIKIGADVSLAEIWTQYDVSLGRKKSISIKLPKVADIPDQSRIRVRVTSDSRGLVNVTPDTNDQIVGLYGTLNATPKGVARSIHGQYTMIELESDGDHEWMIV